MKAIILSTIVVLGVYSATLGFDLSTVPTVAALKCLKQSNHTFMVARAWRLSLIHILLLARVLGLIMAIKIIDKQFIFKTAKQTIVENQKLILQQCSGHPFITKLYFTFQSKNYIVLGMEYCPGGELFNLLRRVKKMKENDAKFYFIETLLAIQHLHNKGILYRDLKPENIIIDA